MTDGGDCNVIVVLAIEEHAIISAAEAQTSEWWLQLFHITNPIS
jgi:hypothetical protein